MSKWWHSKEAAGKRLEFFQCLVPCRAPPTWYTVFRQFVRDALEDPTLESLEWESGRSEVLGEHQWKGAALAPAAAVTAASQCATDRSRFGSPKRPVERQASQQSMVPDVEIG